MDSLLARLFAVLREEVVEEMDGEVREEDREEEGLLIHGLTGRRPKPSEEKKEEVLTEETIKKVFLKLFYRKLAMFPLKI